MGILLKNGQVLDVRTGESAVRDVLIENGMIVKLAENITPDGHLVYDLAGNHVVPGLIDMHTHLREPGFEEKETIATGTRAAARGGFTAVACMPNTRPVTDSPSVVRHILETAAREGYARVYPIGAITEGQRGERLADLEAMAAEGAVAFSDDGRGVQRSAMMREALRMAERLGKPLIIHAEDEELSGSGSMNEGANARKWGIPGIPTVAETAMIARDVLLAEATGARLHVAHVSAESAVSVIRWAKERGIAVTAEVTPHHLLLTDDIVRPDDPDTKVNPPLREESDRRACHEAFLAGILDIVATDHAPHTPEEKRRPFVQAPFGMVGLEFAFPLLYTHYVETGLMPFGELVQRMSTRPARLFGLPGGAVEEGGPADLTVVDVHTEMAIDPETFFSKGRNTPFRGWKCKGWPVLTLVGGRITYESANFEQRGKIR
jgi:dihydroorotase